MSRFNKNGQNLDGAKLDAWVQQAVSEEPPAEVEAPDTQEPTPDNKPQGKKRNKRSKS